MLTPTITYTAGSGAGSNFTLVPNSLASIVWTGTAFRLLPGSYPVGQSILDVSGTALAPSYSFSADASSGMFMPAVSNVALSTVGVERLRVNASGWVGIGTTTPATTFDVSGQITGNINVSNLSGTSTTINVTNPRSMHYYITNSGFNAMTVTDLSAGTNVGAWARLVNNASTATLSVAITNGTGLTTPMTLTSNLSTMIVWNGTSFNQF